MMTTAEHNYFSLMRAALWAEPLELESAPDWSGVMRIARHHATESLVADVASRIKNESQRPPVEIFHQMKALLLGNLLNQMELKQILKKAIKALRDKGIEPVLLKGFGLAQLYPNPNLRQFADIDLYVGQQQFHEACTVLRALSGGYNWGEEQEIGRHYNIEFGKHPMEIHRLSVDAIDPMEQEVYAAIEQDGLVENRQCVVYEGFNLTLPSKEFMVFFTFLHAWEHFLTTGVGWRQLSDVAMTLHVYHGQLDLTKLRTWLVSMRLLEPWQTFGRLMVECLGLPAGEMPLYSASGCRNAGKLYNRIMDEGNFRRKNNFKRHQPRQYLLKKAHSFIGLFVDFFQLVFIFPRQAFYEARKRLKTSFLKNIQKKCFFFHAV